MSAFLQFGPRRKFAVISFGGQAIGATLLFGGAVLTARLLGTGGKGVYSVWTTAIEAGAVLLGGSVSIGLGRAWLRGERMGLSAVALRHAFLVMAVVVPASAIGLAFGLPAIPLVTCIAFGIPLTVAINDLLLTMMAAKRPFAFHAVRVVGTLPLVLGLALIAVTDSVSEVDALDLAFFLFAGGVLLSACAAFGLGVRLPRLAHPASVREYARRGQGAYAGLVADWLVVRADRFIVPAIAGSGALGIYSVAVNFAEVSVLAGTSIALSIFEDEGTLDRPESRRILKLATFVVAGTSLAVVIPAFFSIGLIFGEAFESARWVVLLMWPGVIARALVLTAASMLLARGKGRENSRVAIITAITAIPTWTAGVLLYGIEGAALTVSLIYGLQLALTLRVLWPRTT